MGAREAQQGCELKQKINQSSPNEETVHPSADPNHEKREQLPVEIGGRGGLDPTRYGDWEKNGRCIDF